jgi:glutamate 5-kinase
MSKRIVVKIGTRTLSAADGTVDKHVIVSLVAQIAALKKQGHQVILVSSGAVGAGKSIFSLQGEGLPEKQVYAAIGQAHLIQLYGEMLAPYNIICAQILATQLDFQDQDHNANMLRCLENLLHDNVLPIINENDVVALEELMFTDNDELAGLIAKLLKADLAVFMTFADGVLGKDDEVIASIAVTNLHDRIESITDTTSLGGRGGMIAKFAISKQLAFAGIDVRIVNGRTQNILLDAVAGKSVGTLITRSNKAPSKAT